MSDITFKLIGSLVGHTHMVEGFSLANGSKLLLSFCRGGTARIWDAKTFEQIDCWSPFNGIELYFADLSPDLRYLMAGFTEADYHPILDRKTRQVVTIPANGIPGDHPRFANDENAVLTCEGNSCYKLYFNEPDRRRTRLCQLNCDIDSNFVSQKKKYVILDDVEDNIWILNTKTSAFAKFPKNYNWIHRPSFLEKSHCTYAVIIGGESDQLDVWHINDDGSSIKLKKAGEIPLNYHAHYADFFSDKILFHYSGVHGLSILQCEQPQEIKSFEVCQIKGDCNHPVIDHNKQRLYIPKLPYEYGIRHEILVYAIFSGENTQ